MCMCGEQGEGEKKNRHSDYVAALYCGHLCVGQGRETGEHCTCSKPLTTIAASSPSSAPRRLAVVVVRRGWRLVATAHRTAKVARNVSHITRLLLCVRCVWRGGR